MTPPAATHAASASHIALELGTDQLASGATARLFDAHTWAKLRLLTDVVVLSLASSAALFAAASIRAVSTNHWLAAAFPLIVLAVMRARPSPDDRLFGTVVDTFAHIVGAISLAAILTIAADAILGGAHPVGVTLRLWLFAVVYLGIARVVMLSLWRRAAGSDALSTPTLIIGAGNVGKHLAKRLVEEPRYGLRPVGYLDSDPLVKTNSSEAPTVPVLGGADDLGRVIAETGARRVILAFSTEPDRVLVAKVRDCERLGVDVSLVPRLYESINERATLDHVGGVPLLSLHPVNLRGWQFAVKHALDRSFAFFALLALAPPMVATALAVRVTSPGPILFRQRRVGRDGREFDLLKFRTMREPAASEEAFELPHGLAPGGIEGEDRRTPIGRYLRDSSLDELPQFLNVLRGQMSLVGPRPERPEFVERFSRDVTRYEDRHRVKSGLTGWAQVHGLRGQTSIADRVEWDNYYIQNWSLRLDLRILVLTVAEVLRLRG